MAKYSPAQNRATQKYIRNNYDMLRVRIRKDAEMTKADIQAAADRAGESVAEYVTGAIRQRIDADADKDDAICTAIMDAYDADDTPDKHDTMSLEDFAESVGVAL